MADAILTRRGMDTSDATATTGEILTSKTAYVNGDLITGTMPNNGAVSHSLAVNGSYTVPAGYHNGSGSITQALTTKGAQTYTPGTTDQTIAANQYLTGIQTIAGDADLVSANIKAGANIFGVAGNSNVVDTSPGTAGAGDLLSGKIAFVDGAQITGTMPNQGGADRGASSVDVATQWRLKLVPPAGYYDGVFGVFADDSDFLAGNIKAGVNIFGIAGTYNPQNNQAQELAVSLVGNGSSPYSAESVGSVIGAVVPKAIVVSVSARESYGLYAAILGSTDGGSSWVTLATTSYGNTSAYGHASNITIITAGTAYNRFKITVSNGSNWFVTTAKGHVII